MNKIILKTEDDFKEIILPINEYSYNDDNYVLICRGIHKKMKVGIKITIKNNMKPGVIDDEIDKNAFYKESIIISSIRIESDNFVKVLSNHYGINIKKKFTNKSLSFTSFALMRKDFSLQKDYIRLKLFFDDTNSLGLYFEIYCNIDLKKGFIEFSEKDTEYRMNIIKALTL